jgi:hypothetical protein
MKSVPSENILKLRELTDKLCNVSNDESREVLEKLKNIIYENKIMVDSYKTERTKLKCYENMCNTIIGLLSETKTI